MLSNVGGSIMDITNPKYLPLAMSVYSFGPLNGPVLGPLMVSSTKPPLRVSSSQGGKGGKRTKANGL